jgi:feruloyl esterase
LVAITTHPPAATRSGFGLRFHTANWNGRFLGTGGGGFSGGSRNGVNQPAALGFAAGATDTGHTGGTASFALDARGKLDWQAIRNFAHVGIHDMTVGRKGAHAGAVRRSRRAIHISTAVRTGGRQGLMEAQRYPMDYDGIAAAAPAVNWTNLLMPVALGLDADEHGGPIPSQRASSRRRPRAAVAACDGIDGVNDGVIEDTAPYARSEPEVAHRHARPVTVRRSRRRDARHHPQALGGTTAP